MINEDKIELEKQEKVKNIFFVLSAFISVISLLISIPIIILIYEGKLTLNLNNLNNLNNALVSHDNVLKPMKLTVEQVMDTRKFIFISLFIGLVSSVIGFMSIKKYRNSEIVIKMTTSKELFRIVFVLEIAWFVYAFFYILLLLLSSFDSQLFF